MAMLQSSTATGRDWSALGVYVASGADDRDPGDRDPLRIAGSQPRPRTPIPLKRHHFLPYRPRQDAGRTDRPVVGRRRRRLGRGAPGVGQASQVIDRDVGRVAE